MRDTELLTEDGHTLSTKFKTVGTYKFQPIMLAPVSFKIFSIYNKTIRPMILPKQKWNLNDPLFITYQGVKEENIGTHVQSYFRKKIKTNVTTTVIRSIYETEAHELYKKGKISLSDKIAIGQINGHNGATAKKYYLKETADDNVSRAREVLKCWSISKINSDPSEKGNNSSEENDNNDDIHYFPNSINNTPKKYFKAPWGTEHSCYRSKKAKIKWDQAEVDYLGNIATKLLDEDSNKFSKLLMARCLQIIKEDKDALPIFHENHVLSTNALKHGWKKYQNQNGIDI